MTEVTREHMSVSELLDTVKGALGRLGDPWVVGEISSVKTVRSHVYIDLVERRGPSRQVVGKLHVVALAPAMNRMNHRLRSAGVKLEEGLPVRLQGTLGTYAPSGSLQLMASDIDASWTLGQLVADKDAVLKQLTAEGLVGRQARFEIAPVPLKVAVVTGANSAAEADFCQELEASGIAWQLMVVNCQVQGVEAPRLVASALERISRIQGWQPDVVAVVRGGGSRSDLSTFDSDLVGRMVANAPWPVLTGIGHETDRSVADEVAHRAFKTPTAVAQALVGRVRRYHDELEAMVDRTMVNSVRDLERKQAALMQGSVRLVNAGLRTLEHAELGLSERGARIVRAADVTLAQRLRDIERSTSRLEGSGRRAFDASLSFLTRAQAVTEGADPARVLARGYSITRSGGALVKDVGALRAGDVIETETLSGTVRSRIIEEEA